MVQQRADHIPALGSLLQLLLFRLMLPIDEPGPHQTLTQTDYWSTHKHGSQETQGPGSHNDGSTPQGRNKPAPHRGHYPQKGYGYKAAHYEPLYDANRCTR